MKSLRHLLIWVGAAGLVFAGCERHEFENTKRLHMEHGEHHDEAHGDEHHDGDHHKADHKEDGHDDHHKGDHKKDDHSHDEKKADDAKGKAKAKKDAPRDTGL